MPILDRHILDRNANVDEGVLSESTRVANELRRLGIAPGRAYRLEPALGGELRKYLKKKETETRTENHTLSYRPPETAD